VNIIVIIPEYYEFYTLKLKELGGALDPVRGTCPVIDIPRST